LDLLGQAPLPNSRQSQCCEQFHVPARSQLQCRFKFRFASPCIRSPLPSKQRWSNYLTAHLLFRDVIKTTPQSQQRL
jgi:hypothetical protein